MKLIKDAWKSMTYYGKALDIIFTKGLWWFFAFPLALNLIFFFGGFYFVGSLSDSLVEWVNAQMDLNPETWWAALLTGTLSWLVWFILKLIFFFTFAYFGGYIVIVLLSPVFSYLSERTEKILTGKKYDFDFDQLMRDVVRGILIATRNVLIEILWMIGCFIITFIPIIGFAGPILLFFVTSYFYGFSFSDYSLERRKMTISQSVSFMRRNKGSIIGNGIIYSIFMLIPFCGVTLAGFAAIVSVVAATISVHQIENKSIKIA